MNQSTNPPSPPPPSKTQVMDPSLHAIGFVIDEFSPEKVSGHLLVTSKCCQGLKMLHGGVSAMIAEGIASIGAFMASGRRRVAGVQLSINHLKSAQLGDFVSAEATPLNIGKTIQVWDVRIWKCDPSNLKIKTLVAFSRVTLFSNLSLPGFAKDAAQDMIIASKL